MNINQENQVEKQDDRAEILELYKGLRVTDVRDGMDWVGYHQYGTVHHSIKPLFRGAPVIGIAHTARYLPFEGPAPRVTGDEYTQWVKWYYREVCNDPWGKEIQEGDFMVLDVAGLDVGLLGSNNTLDFKGRGCVGYLTNGGGIRDTDEVIMQGIPVWSKFVSQGMDQTRIRYYEKDIPVSIGGVAVYPGDVVVADGDGVIVVPRKIAKEVAKYAHQELTGDKAGRKKHYETLGWKLDDSVL
ncbi:RraA family protein [Jeotgalibacillus proteolyticus]|uniref:Putative 4-hydroxy-4-methyl-2-oxoglutarate aldolase n=1 Tax=Jeotgalibacillus proteolyticus TaxID=2082395 RepID=A0A2S5GBW8_9BACL|nr:RraA family protein [Jeotgalibacillus proteolyticus]PPA70411.1 dimethylmenaquinone methyltransferase [Jeotgalibacillus proteolyticus]